MTTENSSSNGAPSPLSSQDNATNDSTSQCPFHVLGIALVVEEPGKGARMAFRYPVTAGGVDGSAAADDDLFFTLSPRVMAKLFRPKKPLCGQPTSLFVGGTVFCCRAILMKDCSHLDLFNVIVALAPTVPTSDIPIAGWDDAMEHVNNNINNNTEDSDDGFIPSSSFLALRRVHISIARLCRVLEREERRCQYVSLQSSQLWKIQETRRQELDQRTKQLVMASSGGGANSIVQDAAGSVSEAGTQTSKRRSHHRRGLSGSTMAAISAAAAVQAETSSDMMMTTTHPPQAVTVENLQYEVEQDILELLLATSPPSEHHGNLAHELVQVYHALAWNDDEFLPTPSILLSGSHGIVYINRHVAVCIEPACGTHYVLDSHQMPRSYQTLLFPHASVKELVQTLQQQSSAVQELQQMLLMVNPRKSLLEISMDAALPLQVTLELAAFLVQQNACIVSSVLTRKTKLACTQTKRMQECALDFVQEFGGISIFLVVSVLTSNGMTCGECMSATSASAKHAVPIRINEDALLLGREIIKQVQSTEGSSPNTAIEIEEVVYSMAVWLRSHQVLINMEEYLVAVGAVGVSETQTSIVDRNNDSSASSDSWQKAVEDSTREEQQLQQTHPEEALYKELLECLTGNVSTAALCWRYEIDPLQLHRFRSWGILNNKLRVLTRVPRPTDDWNSSMSEQ